MNVISEKKRVPGKNIFLRNHVSEKIIFVRDHNSENNNFLRNKFNQTETKTTLANFPVHASIPGNSSLSVPN